MYNIDEIRRIIANKMFPSNPDMGGNEYNGLTPDSKRKIDNTIDALMSNGFLINNNLQNTKDVLKFVIDIGKKEMTNDQMANSIIYKKAIEAMKEIHTDE